jgi:hypothetical protein
MALTRTYYVFNVSPNEVFDALAEMLPRYAAFRVDRVDPSTMKIEVKTKAGMRSWGEKVEVAVTEDGPRVRVDVSSRPKLPGQMTAGKHADNFSLIERALRNGLGHIPGASVSLP